jgi:Tol biopolymer transport system component
VGTGVSLVFNAASSSSLPSPAEYTQITNFTDSAVSPSLSRDGRFVTFIRGGEAFLSRGQVFVKALPDGESIQLTNDVNVKYGPVFSPDGSRIAYTRISSGAGVLAWDTWAVPRDGGAPTALVTNAAGLTWLGDGRTLLAEIKRNVHMAIVAADESGSGRRDVYVPRHGRGMAHYAYASPDRRWVLVVEMDHAHLLDQPCRLVPFDGASPGRLVGPPGGCTAADWSPDGRWMYFSVSVGASSHLWRQRFPDGAPEQLTFGPTEEEGVTAAPDGRSLLTSLGMRRSSIWIRDPTGERPLTSEGYARMPRFSRDGTRVFYLQQHNANSPDAELRVIDLRAGRATNMLPGVRVIDYDVSLDEREIAYTIPGNGYLPRIAIARIDGTVAPTVLAGPGDQVSFGADGDLIFRSLEGGTNSIVRWRRQSGVSQRLASDPVGSKYGVSPDGRWVIAVVHGSGDHSETVTLALPVDGGTPRRVCSPSCPTWWGSDGRTLYVSRGKTATSPARSVAIPIPEGRMLPDLPEEGIDSIAGGLKIPGSVPIEHDSVAPFHDPSTYVFTRSEIQQNLYRIPLR